MMRKTIKVVAVSVVISFTGLFSVAQSQKQKCLAPVLDRKDVQTPAKILQQPNFNIIYKRLSNTPVRIVVDAVLCNTGEVTEVRIIESSAPNINAFVVQAFRQMRFTPAQIQWHKVSQRQRFEFSINGASGVVGIDATAAAGRQVEDLDVIGYRRFTFEQIKEWIKTRPGDTFNPDQIDRDLGAILATGYFSAIGTRVITEDAVRGGVRVIFEVQELPLITEIKFEGVQESEQAAIREELVRKKTNVKTGAPLNLVGLKQATRVIEQWFAHWLNIKAEAFVENTSATEVTVIFKISGYNFRS